MTQFDSCSLTENDQNYGTITSTKSSSDFSRPNTPISNGEHQPLLASSKLSHSTHKLDNENDSTVSLLSKLGYALGHIHNDLFSCLSFSYSVLYMTKVLEMTGSEAGGLIMFGQIIDTAATPAAGYLIDKYGTKQKWHIFGEFNLRTKCTNIEQNFIKNIV